VDGADRGTQGRAEPGERHRGGEGAVAAGGVPLGGPVAFDVVDGVVGRRAEVAGQVGEHAGTASGRVEAGGGVGVPALHEADQHAGAAAGRGSVEDGAERAPVAVGLAAEPLGPPERLVVQDVDLDDAAHGEALDQLRTVARQVGLVAQACGERRRHGDDRPAGPHRDAVRQHGHAGAVPVHRGHRGVQADPVAQGLGQPQRDALRAADDLVLLRSPVGVDQRVEAARRADVGEGPQRRHVLWLRGEHRLGDQAQEGPPSGRVRVAPHPGGERLAVERHGPRGRPRLGGRRDRAGRTVQPPLRLGDVGQDHRAEPGNAPGVGDAPPAELGDVPPVHVRRVRGEPQLADEREHPVLPGSDELAAEVHRHAGPFDGVQPAADPVPRLQHHDLVPVRGQLAGGHQPGDPGPHDHDIDVHRTAFPRAVTARLICP
jgi:hypothetical protein